MSEQIGRRGASHGRVLLYGLFISATTLILIFLSHWDVPPGRSAPNSARSNTRAGVVDVAPAENARVPEPVARAGEDNDVVVEPDRAASGLTIGALVASGETVPLYAKFEVTFRITDTLASQPQFPYDPDPPAGLSERRGITVDGLFLPPGQSDWGRALVQPAFLYQPYVYADLDGNDWIYPQGERVWTIRFAAQTPGLWRYKVRAQDASICPARVSPCADWIESDEGSFTVGSTSSVNPGFIPVSQRDPRYFEFNSEEPFVGVGHATDFDSLVDARRKLTEFSFTMLRVRCSWQSKGAT